MWFIAPAMGVMRAGMGMLRAGMGMMRGMRGQGFGIDSLLKELLGSLKPPRITVRHNIPETIRWLGDVGKQVDYAAAVALTRTAKRLQPILEAEVRKSFHKPLPFTIKAFGITPANRSTLTATVYIRPKQARYLLPNIVGGQRKQKAFERRLSGEAGVNGYWVPGEGVKLTAAGNMTQRQIQQIASKLRQSGRFAEVFVGVPRGQSLPFGIWGRTKATRRKAGKIVPLMIKTAAPSYRRRFDFYGIGQRHAQSIFKQEFDAAFSLAMRTVRPARRIF